MGDDQDVEKGRCNNSHTTSSDAQTRISRKGYHTLGDSADGYDGLDEEGDRPLATRTNRVRAAGVETKYVQVNAASREEDGEESSSENEIANADKTTRHLAFFGCLSVVYVLLQFWGSFAFGSLALLSDAFHNLFDVGAIGLASYTHRLQRKQDFSCKDGSGDTLPFGYKRAEVIGGLINCITLLSLSAYVVLTAIPRLFVPTEVNSGWAYIGLAFGGVLVNLVGVVSFAASGHDCHGDGQDGGFLFAHSHSHGHGHGYDVNGDVDSDEMDSSIPPCSCGADHDERNYYGDLQEEQRGRAKVQHSLSTSAVTDAAVRKRETELTPRETTVEGDDEVLSGGANQNEFCLGTRSGEQHCDEFGREEAWVPDGRCVHQHENALSCDGVGDVCPFDHVRGASGLSYRRKRSQSDGRSDSHARSGFAACNGNGHDSGVSGVADTAGKDHDDHDHHGHHGDHGHHGHLHLEDNSSHQVHAHGHSLHSHCPEHADVEHGDRHGHGHENKGGPCGGGQSMNIFAVFLHALVDVVSSALVCIQSAMIYFLGSRDRVEWTDYLDPLTSIALSFFIAWTALPLVKECVHVLLEGTPRDTDLSQIKAKLGSIPGVSSVLHLSIIQLNGRDPHVAMVSLVVSNMESSCDHGEGGDQRRLLTGAERGIDQDRILCDAKGVLSRFHVGRSSIEIVSRAYVNEETRFGEEHEVDRPCTRAGRGAGTGALQDGRGRESYERDRDRRGRDHVRGSSSSQAHHVCNIHVNGDPIVHRDDLVSGGDLGSEPSALEGVEHISHDSSAVLV